MASGGSSGRTSSGPRSFDFGADDVLCSYDDFSNQDPSTGKRPETAAKLANPLLLLVDLMLVADHNLKETETRSRDVLAGMPQAYSSDGENMRCSTKQ